MGKPYLIGLIVGFFFIPALCFPQECVVGETQQCFCPDGSTSLQYCKTDGSGWESCDCISHTIWCEDETGLCWQDPQKDPHYGDEGVISQDAVRYCDELVFGGYDDWRLPNIDELRTLIHGNPETEPGGVCPVTEGSGMEDAVVEACLGSEDLGGPGLGGCYWDPELTGLCNKEDFAGGPGHSLEYWATTQAADDPDHWIAYVFFDSAAVGFNHVNSFGDVRCVRNAPSPLVACEEPLTACTPGETRQCTCSGKEETGAQVCADDGSCYRPCECTGFTPSLLPEFPWETCDKVILTINLPEQLDHQPHELMAYYYKAEGWEFPPMRPPDGGTDFNGVLYPDIDIDNPYVMTVPGCTYYKENCIYGNYYLYVSLMMEERWPPLPGAGDYYWGMDQTPITFPFGVEHQSGEIQMEITLVPVDKSLPSVLNIGDQWANCGDVGVKIPICLINLYDEVGAVQVDLCEDINDCLICVGCEMTERTVIFDCMVNELDNGCCAVVVFSKNPGGVINPGECDIVIIDYTLKDDPECCNTCIVINGENLEVVDQYGYLVTSAAWAGYVCPFECGDVEPAASTATIWDCGDGDIDIFDILEEVDFIIHVKTPDDCQAVRADVPTGTPPNCDPPDGVIDVGDLMVIIDMALNRQDCCSYYYGGVIY